MMRPPPLGSRFPRRVRLAHAREFDAAFKTGARVYDGPVAIAVRRNTFDHARLGLSIGRRVGTAAARARFKRLIREAFRLEQHDLPRWARGGFDLVVSLRPHEPAPLETYRRVVRELAIKGAAALARRPEPPPDGGP